MSTVVVASPAPLQPGVVVGSYEIVELIGAGGMGEVYRARHKAIGRQAAVKVLKAERMTETNASDQFLKEATTLGALSHPNLVDVLDFGHLPNGQPYLTMAFIDGQTLHDVIGDSLVQTGGGLSVTTALQLTEQVLNALGEAHKKGIVHRDLKPANVMVLKEHNGELLVKVLDFGLARPVDGAILPWASLASTKASSAAGTPAYVSPEQVRNEDLDGRADLYSLGCTLYEMLTGHAPFVSESPLELVKQQLDAQPPSLAAALPNLPEEVERLVLWFLQKRRDERPENADVARAEVRRLLSTVVKETAAVASPSTLPSLEQLGVDEGAVRARAPSSSRVPPREPRRWPWVALAGVLVLGAVGAVALVGEQPPQGELRVVPLPSPPVTVDAPVAPPVPEPLPSVTVTEPAIDTSKVAIAPVRRSKAPRPAPCTFTDDFKALARRDHQTLRDRAGKSGVPTSTLDALEEAFGDAMVKRDCRGTQRVLDKLRRFVPAR